MNGTARILRGKRWLVWPSGVSTFGTRHVLQGAVVAANHWNHDRCHSTMNTTDIHHHQSTTTFNYDQVRQEILQQWMKAQAQTAPTAATTTTARYCCFTLHDAQRAYQDPNAPWYWLDRELISNLAGETGAVAIYQGATVALRVRQRFGSRNNNNNNNNKYTAAVTFCQEHQAHEAHHLQLFRHVLPVTGKHTRLLPLWRAAGWTLGFVPTLLGGPRTLYVTVVAVETFVEQHFQEQIRELLKQQQQQQPSVTSTGCDELIRLLEFCCHDEVHHRLDAARHLLQMTADGSASSGNHQTHGDKSETPSSPEAMRQQQDQLEQRYFQTLDQWWIQPWTWIVQTGSAIAADIARRV